jgi:hypothetical protein
MLCCADDKDSYEKKEHKDTYEKKEHKDSKEYKEKKDDGYEKKEHKDKPKSPSSGAPGVALGCWQWVPCALLPAEAVCVSHHCAGADRAIRRS